MNEQLPIQLSPQLSFDMTLPDRARRIRNLVDVARGCIIEVGRELIAAKAEVAHGEWLPWLEREFGWSIRTADNYMNVAAKFASVANFSGVTIDATALYALSAPEVPQSTRDEAIERAEDGEHVTLADAEAMIASALLVEREKFEALVAELQAEADAGADVPDAPDIPTLVEQLCKATGKKKLKPAQLQHLACILGTAITDGSKVYPPSSLEETQQGEERLRISAPALRALEYFLAAPDPDVVTGALQPFQADTARRCVGVAVSWLKIFDAKLGRA